MRPAKPLPYSDEFSSADEYVDALLHYISTTPIFQTLCGGVHIMDFYTTDPGLFYSVVPADWQSFLLDQEPMELLDFLLRDDMDAAHSRGTDGGRVPVPPPASLVHYVRDVRRLCLQRMSPSSLSSPPPLARKITMGMSVKKVHEVTHFADFVSRLADDVSAAHADRPITHLVDVGSGQNYLGRALACPPYRRRVVAVESKGHNIAGARGLDVLTGVTAAPAQRPMRNKKLYQQLLSEQLPPERQSQKVRNRLARMQAPSVAAQPDAVAAAELRSRRELLDSVYSPTIVTATPTTTVKTVAGESAPPADSPILYVQGRLENGDLSDVLAQVPPLHPVQEPGFLAVSIHSCGNLSHYGLRALVLNPAVRAVAIVGCCYNLLTEKLGPPTYKLPGLRQRPTLQPVNGRVVREAERRDPEGFPMSARMSTYAPPGSSAGRDDDERGIRFNITARMMACQAPQNWTAAESESFFTRHFYRAILQRIFLDRGVVDRVRLNGEIPKKENGQDGQDGQDNDTALNTAVSPIIIGSLRKACYSSLPAYVRGAVAKIAAQGSGHGDGDGDDDNDNDNSKSSVNASVAAKMAGLTDAELDAYAARYGPRLRELSAVWSLMAFSAGVVESAIVTDRWLYLREQQVDGVDGGNGDGGVVDDCWVESVFAYGQSPRNLVVVGIKR